MIFWRAGKKFSPLKPFHFLPARRKCGGLKKSEKTDKMTLVMELLRDFKNISKSDISLVGGKGASLGEMIGAEIPVPPGFVILVSAFEKFLEETDLNVEIDAALDSVNRKEMHTVEAASEKIKALILEAEMPKDIAKEIQKFFKNLDSKYVAVRSSATAEDSASAAWAGQLESYLNTTEENLLENVKKCWASLFTPRAIFYRFEKDLHKQKISVAVVVQTMVESERSGIAFSVHPITQDRNQLIIEAGLGLGEAIVSGQITPDSYVVEKQPRRIIDKNVQTQTKGLYRAEKGGNEWHDIPKEQGEKQVLSDKEILELSRIILQIETHYGFPCDIEWAFEKEKFFIIQSRPITTLSQVKDSPQQYINQISRDMSLTAIYYPFLVQTGLIKSPFGFKCKNMFYFSSRSFIKGYKTTEDDKQMREQIVKFVEKGKLTNILKTFETIIRQRIKKTETFVKTDLDKKSRQWVIDQFKKFHKFYLRYWSYHLFAFNLAKTIENTPYQRLLKENERLINEVRQHNPFLFFDEEYLPHLFSYLVKTFSVEKRLLYFLTPNEIITLMETENDIDWQEIRKRLKYYLLCKILDKEIIYSATKALDEYNKIVPQPSKQDISREIKGDIAYKGKVTGKVKVVLLKKDLQNIPKNSILVAPQTTPEFTPKLKNVAAIVTDEGGILCHAAIISRELKKPCIIGTKIATQVLKDGDFIEVNADEGVVKILK